MFGHLHAILIIALAVSLLFNWYQRMEVTRLTGEVAQANNNLMVCGEANANNVKAWGIKRQHYEEALRYWEEHTNEVNEKFEVQRQAAEDAMAIINTPAPVIIRYEKSKEADCDQAKRVAIEHYGS